ncbi:MAG: hypothetical protein IMF09_11425 [Proteobacteria bacterium]|nr:hypothetical protein [Pseudomonadota bacterium]
MKLIKWLAVVALAVAIAAGVSVYQRTQNPGLSDEQAVEIRAVAWLQAVIAKDWAATYQFTSSGYRSGVSQLDHERTMSMRRVSWLGGELVDTSCEEDACQVDVRIVYKVIRPMRSVPEFESFQSLTRTWLKQDGEWWLTSSE